MDTYSKFLPSKRGCMRKVTQVLLLLLQNNGTNFMAQLEIRTTISEAKEEKANQMGQGQAKKPLKSKKTTAFLSTTRGRARGRTKK